MSDYFLSSDSDQDLDYWDFPPKTSYFPVSNARDTSWTEDQFAEANRNRRESCVLQLVSPKRIVELPKIHQISDGFLREDGQLLYTAKHPSVLRCLEYSRTHWRLPANVPEEILALAALETFLHPFDPAHWLFWSNEQKDQSAKLVQSHIGRHNRIIYHPFSWSILDWKFRLSGIHNKQLPEVLCSKPWYDTLVLSTYLKDVPIRGPVLRRRKVQLPADTHNANTEKTKYPEQLPANPSKITRAQPSHEVALSTDSIPETKYPSLNIPALGSSIDPPCATFVTPDTPVHFQPLHGPTNPSRSNNRLSRKSSQNPLARASSSSTSSPTPSSIALPVTEYSRTRSSSRLSARTLVEDTRALSPSSSSATTAADLSSAKGKQKVVDEPAKSKPRLIGVMHIGNEDSASLVDTISDEEVDVPFPRLTRARSSATKTGMAFSGPQRSQLGRKNRANINPYSAEKLVRRMPHPDSITEEFADSTAIISSPAGRKSRKAKTSRR